MIIFKTGYQDSNQNVKLNVLNSLQYERGRTARALLKRLLEEKRIEEERIRKEREEEERRKEEERRR